MPLQRSKEEPVSPVPSGGEGYRLVCHHHQGSLIPLTCFWICLGYVFEYVLKMLLDKATAYNRVHLNLDIFMKVI